MSHDAPERVAFFPGQRLAAADLTALQDTNRDLRWLHTRTLHGWGIADGFGVRGSRGDTFVLVRPGVGVDVRGREIVLAAERRFSVPAVASAPGGGEAVFYLVAAYLDDADQTVLEQRDGVCLPAGTVRLADEPLVDWRRHDQLKEGLELVLAKLWVKGCRLSRPVSLDVQRRLNSEPSAYVAAGQTVPGQTEWKAWEANGKMIGLRAHVDTSASHFNAAPQYLARLAGDRYRAQPPGPFVAVVMPGVEDATRDGFTLSVLIPELPGSLMNPAALRHPTSTPALVRDDLQWHVAWVGVEGAP